ncbi:MAG: transporter substrate-binding domain-containing protein [Syntrophus sp. (in: bacteria)]
MNHQHRPYAVQLVWDFAFLLLFYLLLNTATPGHCTSPDEAIPAPRKVIAVIPADLPPTYFLDKSGKPAGFAIDVMNALARRSGLTVEYVNSQGWDDAIQKLLSGKADLIPSLTIDEPRKELLAFTETVDFLLINLVVASGNRTVQEISPGLTIGVLKGSAPHNFLKKNQAIKLTTFNDIQTMLFELLAGHVDGIVSLTSNIMKLAADVGVDDKIKVVGKPIIEAKRGIALRKGDTELLTRLNKSIGELIDSSEYRQIYGKWYGKPKSYWTTGRIGAFSGILLFLIVCGMAFWRYCSIVRLNNDLTLNIAERKQAEKILLDVIDKNPMSIQIVDKDGYVLKVNSAHTRLFGSVPPSDYTIFNDFQLKQQGYTELIERAKSGEIVTFPEIFYNAHNVDPKFSDVPVWIRMVIFPINDSYGKPERFVTMHDDITERKRAEVALQELRSLTDAVVEHVPLMIFLKEATDLRFVIFNRAGEELLGYDRKDLLGKNNLDLFPPEQAAHFMAKDRDVLDGETGILDIPEEPIMTAKKGQRLLHTRKVCIRGNDGVTKYLLGISEDITDRKQAETEKRSLEERLQRSEKMESLGLLAGGVAHDLNNVLGIVVGYAELILDSADASSSIRPHLVNIMSGGQRAAAIVDDMLTLARRGVSGKEVLNLNKIIADCQKSPDIEKLCSYHPSVKIKTDIDPDLLNISGSSVHLAKSLYNLVSNACEAMTKGGVVTIKTTNQYLDKPIQGYDQILEGDYVVLSVSDTGEGISANDLKRIFEPFYTKKIMGRSGTGLGLAVVWGTAKDHNGYINVQSEEGKGSTFTLYFPVTREDLSAEAAVIAISEYMGKGETILVVDDVKEQRDLAAGMLDTLNYIVSSVSSGEAAVAYMKEHEVDLIVLDMIMDPGMDGLDTYIGVLEIRPKQKAIIVSGFSESDRVRAAQGLGAGAYVRKPYIKEKLGLAVRKELDRAVQTRED